MNSELTCNACGARYAEKSWATLVLSQRIEAAEVQRHVVAWPDDVGIEVRVCKSCAALMARKEDRGATARGCL